MTLKQILSPYFYVGSQDETLARVIQAVKDRVRKVRDEKQI